MKKIRLLWVGRSKDPFIREGIDKYLTLLKPYARVELIELREAAGPDAGTVQSREGERILGAASGYVLLDETGETMTSVQFAALLGTIIRDAIPRDFVIGGAFGVSEEVRRSAWRRVSLSSMTFTHQMARIILLEQLYRGFTILQGRSYHHG